MLTPKQKKFTVEYLKDLNATQAAIRAGYAPGSADVTGCRLLTHANVAKVIQAKQAELAEQAGVTVRRVVDELARIAFADVRGLFGPDGQLLPVHQLPEDVARAVAGVEVTKTRTWTKDEETTSEAVTKVRSWDKPKSLELLAKHLGMLRDRVEHSGEIQLPVRVVHEYQRLEAAHNDSTAQVIDVQPVSRLTESTLSDAKE